MSEIRYRRRVGSQSHYVADIAEAQLMVYQPGPFDTAHWYLQWGGKLPGGEQWSCGLRLVPVNGATATINQTAIDAAASAVTAYHTGGTGISPRALLSFVKLNDIDVTGHQGPGNTNVKVLADVPGGSAAVSNTPPNQVALTVSLTTGYSRGPAHRGRFYLPLPTFAIDATGTFSAQNAQGVSGATDTFIAALNAISANRAVAVMSRKLGAPGHRVVTGNLVGRVYDTQRRRRRSIPEDYQ